MSFHGSMTTRGLQWITLLLIVATVISLTFFMTRIVRQAEAINQNLIIQIGNTTNTMSKQQALAIRDFTRTFIDQNDALCALAVKLEVDPLPRVCRLLAEKS